MTTPAPGSPRRRGPFHRSIVSVTLAAGIAASLALAGYSSAGSTSTPTPAGGAIELTSDHLGSTSGTNLACGVDPATDPVLAAFPGTPAKMLEAVPAKDAASRLGAGPDPAPETDANPMIWVAKKVGEDVFDGGVSEGFGWLLNLIAGSKGEKPGPDLQKSIDASANQVKCSATFSVSAAASVAVSACAAAETPPGWCRAGFGAHGVGGMLILMRSPR
jgi:hypothetical protein